MNLYPALISFFFGNILADITDYINVVAITNSHVLEATGLNIDLVGNGLEHAIKTIVCDNIYTMDRMNCMIAVPEYASVTDIQGSINHQIILQMEISIELSVPVPNAPNPNFVNLNLTDLGKARRLLTRPALKKIIDRILDGEEPGITSAQLCSLIGLWMSTTTPAYYTKTTYIDHNDDCIITDRYNHNIKYRSFDGIYWQVDVNDNQYQILPLKEQLDRCIDLE